MSANKIADKQQGRIGFYSISFWYFHHTWESKTLTQRGIIWQGHIYNYHTWTKGRNNTKTGTKIYHNTNTHICIYHRTPHTYEEYCITKQSMTGQIFRITNIYIHMYIANTGTKNLKRFKLLTWQSTQTTQKLTSNLSSYKTLIDKQGTYIE